MSSDEVRTAGPLERLVSLEQKKRRSLAEIREEHRPMYSRKRLGHHPVSGHTLWGCELTCACGFAIRWNEGKRETEQAWRDHTREVWLSEKADMQANAGA